MRSCSPWRRIILIYGCLGTQMLLTLEKSFKLQRSLRKDPHAPLQARNASHDGSDARQPSGRQALGVISSDAGGLLAKPPAHCFYMTWRKC